jgi:serine/threonine protein kinase
VHRDVKPSNVGFTREGMPKLFDLGLVREHGDPSAATSTEGADATWSASSVRLGIRGTPAYLSPEVLRFQVPGPSDDVWSLGVTLLEALTGTNPLRAATVEATIARILAAPAHLGPLETLAEPWRAVLGEALGDARTRPSAAAFAARIRSLR